MARERFAVNTTKFKEGDIIYGIGELGLVFSYYGKDSKIFRAMVSGRAVSGMIKESIKVSKNGKGRDRELEEKILRMCIDRENLVPKQSVNVFF